MALTKSLACRSAVVSASSALGLMGTMTRTSAAVGSFSRYRIADQEQLAQYHWPPSDRGFGTSTAPNWRSRLSE